MTRPVERRPHVRPPSGRADGARARVGRDDGVFWNHAEGRTTRGDAPRCATGPHVTPGRKTPPRPRRLVNSAGEGSGARTACRSSGGTSRRSRMPATRALKRPERRGAPPQSLGEVGVLGDHVLGGDLLPPVAPGLPLREHAGDQVVAGHRASRGDTAILRSGGRRVPGLRPHARARRPRGAMDPPFAGCEIHHSRYVKSTTDLTPRRGATRIRS